MSLEGEGREGGEGGVVMVGQGRGRRGWRGRREGGDGGRERGRGGRERGRGGKGSVAEGGDEGREGRRERGGREWRLG